MSTYIPSGCTLVGWFESIYSLTKYATIRQIRCVQCGLLIESLSLVDEGKLSHAAECRIDFEDTMNGSEMYIDARFVY